MGAVDLSGQVLHDTYRLERLLGEGGMGEVYVASHTRLERCFAVKLLVPEAARDEIALGRFQREARVTGSLGHPHIVEVVDFNITPDGRPYLVMELLQGEDLARRIERVGPVPLPAIASILRQVTSALHAAHEKDVVHRDLKPENVFLCRRGALDDYVKLLDFGISKVLGSKTVETQQRTLVGSPCYMAPEQADERTTDVDARTDVYAVGTMLYEMLAGAPPFNAASLPSLLYKIVHVAPPDIRAARPDVPEPLVDVLAIAMHKDPDLRYPTMEALWLALSDGLESAVSGIEKTEISHTAWPGQPALAIEKSGEHVAVPPRPAAPAPQLGRSTTLSVSAGELTPLGRRRGTALALVAGGLLLLSLGVLLALVLTPGPSPRTGPVVAAVGPDTRAPVGPAPDLAAGPDLSVRPDLAGGPRPAGPTPKAHARRRRLPPATLNVAAKKGGAPTLVQVFLDGRFVGRSPRHLGRLRPGRHVVEVRRFGKRKRQVVRLEPGERRSLVFDLDR